MLDEDGIHRLLQGKAMLYIKELAAYGLINSRAGSDLMEELEPMLVRAAKLTSSDPDKLSMTLVNFDRVLHEVKVQAQMRGSTSGGLRKALSKLCPIFPFC